MLCSCCCYRGQQRRSLLRWCFIFPFAEDSAAAAAAATALITQQSSHLICPLSICISSLEMADELQYYNDWVRWPNNNYTWRSHDFTKYTCQTQLHLSIWHMLKNIQLTRERRQNEENKNHLFYSYTTEENYREWETSRPERFSSAFTMRCIKAWGWWLARKPRTLLCPDSHSATCKHICRTTHTIHSVEVFLFPQRCSICNQFRLTVDDSFNLTIRFSQESEAGRYNGIC